MISPKLLTVSNVVHVLCLAVWAGGGLFFSYVAAPKIFGYLRDRLPANPPAGVQGLSPEIGSRLAGDTVGTIFPSYFALQIIAGVLAAASGLVLARAGHRLDKARCGLALAALVVVTLHAATVYPRSARIRQEQHQAQEAGDEAKETQLRKSFGMLHGISQLLNLVTIILVIVALALAGVAVREPQ